MQIVIDISEELYKNVIEHTKTGYIGSDVWIAVANGTPLPKGEWIQMRNEEGIEMYRKILCSHCNKLSVEKYSFCPNCGAQMKDGARGRSK